MAIEWGADDNVRFDALEASEQLEKSRREARGLLLGGLLTAGLWASFSAVAPLAQRVPTSVYAAAYWPVLLGLMGLGFAAVVALVERLSGKRAAIAVGVLAAGLVPLCFGLIRQDMGALQAVPSSTYAHTQFTARPLVNGFDHFRRVPHDYKLGLGLVIGAVGCSIYALVALPLVVFVTRLLGGLAGRASQKAGWVLLALAGGLTLAGAVRAFGRPTVFDLPSQSAEVAVAKSLTPQTDCPACGEERVPCCHLNVGNKTCVRDYGDTLYHEALGPFTLGRACQHGTRCQLELAVVGEGTHKGRLVGGTTHLDVQVDLTTPVTLRHDAERRIYWLFAHDKPVGFAPAPEVSCPTKRGPDAPIACRVDGRVSAASLLGEVGPPRPAVLAALFGLALAAYMLRKRPLGPAVATLRGDSLAIEQGGDELKTALSSDLPRLRSVLGCDAAFWPVMAALTVIATSTVLAAAASAGFLG